MSDGKQLDLYDLRWEPGHNTPPEIYRLYYNGEHLIDVPFADAKRNSVIRAALDEFVKDENRHPAYFMCGFGWDCTNIVCSSCLMDKDAYEDNKFVLLDYLVKYGIKWKGGDV